VVRLILYADDGPQTPRRMLARASRVVMGVGLPAVTLYYSNDIAALLLLFVIVFSSQANHSHTVVLMQEVICVAVEIYVVSLILHALYSPKIDRRPKGIAKRYCFGVSHAALSLTGTMEGNLQWKQCTTFS
jgi:hypothetical protein